MRAMQQHLMQMQPMMAAYYPNNVTTDHIQQVLSFPYRSTSLAIYWLLFFSHLAHAIYLFLAWILNTYSFGVYSKASWAYEPFDFCLVLTRFLLFSFFYLSPHGILVFLDSWFVIICSSWFLLVLFVGIWSLACSFFCVPVII